MITSSVAPMLLSRFSRSFCSYRIPKVQLASLGTMRRFFNSCRQNSISSAPEVNKTKGKIMEALRGEVLGESGCRYHIEKDLQTPLTPAQRYVYLATAGNQKFVLKPVNQSDFEYFQGLYRQVEDSPYVRGLHDTISNPTMFVFKYLRDDFLDLVQKDLPLAVTKRILKDALRGLAALHDKRILHSDIKANNILVDYEYNLDTITVKKVQLFDIESAAYLPPRGAAHGRQLGNVLWRSPEAHAKGPIKLPSDMFSFAIICIYAVFKNHIFAVDSDSLSGEDTILTVIERQLSYFANPETLDIFLSRLRDNNPWRQTFLDVRARFHGDNLRAPVGKWPEVDPDLRDLLEGLTNFDIEKRLTAQEALEHKWFADV